MPQTARSKSSNEEERKHEENEELLTVRIND
jgi:hypothetical protein